MLRIHLLYEHGLDENPHACAFIRLTLPLSHPSIANSIYVSQGVSLPNQPIDIVIVERAWHPHLTLSDAHDLVSQVRAIGAKLIYTLDDNLIDLHRDTPWNTFPSEGLRMCMRFLAREANGLIVSTSTLKNRFLSLNKNVWVVPNALDERLFPPVNPKRHAKPKQKVTIGYMGTRTHTSDLLMILKPLRDFLHLYRERVSLELVGVYSDPRLEQCFSGFPVKFVDVGNSVNYLDFVPWAAEHLEWDFAIAPLVDSTFNKSKSDIKYLDYAMLGIPGIFSNVTSYRHTVQHNKTGLLCENHSEEWFAALSTLTDKSEFRQTLRLAAYEHVRTTRTLEQRAVDWLSAIQGIANTIERHN